MNVEIKTEAPQFPEKEYINGIFVAVQESIVGTENLHLMTTFSLNSLK